MEFGRDRIDEVKRMAAEKFSTWEWIFGHSREAHVTHSAKMQCGTVEVHLCLDGGVLREVTFTGDFIGDRSVERISSLLKDTKYDIRSVQDALSGVDVSDYFPGTDASSLADLVMGK